MPGRANLADTCRSTLSICSLRQSRRSGDGELKTKLILRLPKFVCVGGWVIAAAAKKIRQRRKEKAAEQAEAGGDADNDGECS